MKKFEVGKSYFCVSVCDHNARWDFTVTKRTDHFINVNEGGKNYRVRVKPSYDGTSEICWPLGKYSMAPILSAEKEI